MHIKSIEVKEFKRFSNLTIENLPNTARLVVMTGPNGCGKSSLFDAFKMWHWGHGGVGGGYDVVYHVKQGFSHTTWDRHVKIEFHEKHPSQSPDSKKIFYIRSAYRNDSDFTSSGLSKMPSALDMQPVGKLIDNDSCVSLNYQRLVSSSIAGVYSGNYDELKVSELRKAFIGQVKEPMTRVFDSLILKGPGDPLQDGTFYFEKGISSNFHYKNLSGGEKAAFDILLDLIVKRTEFDNTIFCIDEPETHIHTKLQALLLEELFSLIPSNSQLWIATHSIGMMRKAKDLQDKNPGEVVFLDFHDRDFDKPLVIEPMQINRQFWLSILDVALDDLADLVAPKKIVLCEGKPINEKTSEKAEFDARCYRIIFSQEFCDTDFVSVGNSHDTQNDRIELGASIKAILSGTNVIRLIDRDDRSYQEVQELIRQGVHVLTKRNIESYLLDDEILVKLCEKIGQPEKISEILAAKAKAIQNSNQRNNPHDDIKSAMGEIYTEVKRILQLTQCGNTPNAFLRDTLAPLMTPDTEIYRLLKKDIFEI